MRSSSPLLSLLLSLVFTGGCQSIPDRGAPGTVVDEREAGSATRVLRLEGMRALVSRQGKPYPPYLAEVKASPHEDGTRLGVVMVNPELRFAECREIELFADEVSVPIRRIEYLNSVGSSGWFEGWWIYVGHDTLAQLAAAKRAGGRFCEAEVWLDEEQMKVLKAFAVRVLR